MAAGGHIGWPKITFDRISRHFRLIRNFVFHKMAASGHFGWPKITFDRIYRHFRSICNFYFFHKMAAGGHFGWPKITFECISRHFRSIHNFFFEVFFKMAAGGHFGSPIWGILDDRKSLSIAFLTISDQYAISIFFFTKWLPATIWDDRKSLSITFLVIPDQYATLIFFKSQNGCRRPFWMTENHFRSYFSPFQINTQLFFLIFFSKWPFWKSDLRQKQ